MKYKIIEHQAAKEIAAALIRRESIDFSEYEKEVGKGAPLAESVLQGIAGQLAKVRKTLEKSKRPPEDLDREGFEIVHRGIPDDADMLGDSRFWNRFALVYLCEHIVWRFPGKGKGFNIENLGIGASQRSRAENYAYKLWIRGDLSMASKGKDPYRAGRYGGVDFWTSHIHRQGFTKCRKFASELIQFQFPPQLNGKGRLWEGVEDAASNKIGVRTLVKRIRRMWASIEFTLLDGTEVQMLLKELSKGLKGADGKSVFA